MCMMGRARLTAAFAASAQTQDEAHAWNAVTFQNMRHGFARGLKCRYFAYSCVSIRRHAMHVTVAQSASERPVSLITGGRRYSFYLEGQANLFTGCK